MARSAVEMMKSSGSNLSSSFSAKKDRSRLTDEDPLIEGWLFRSTSVADMVNRRYGRVFPSGIRTYRSEAPDSPPTKMWTLDRGCSISEIESKEFMIRDKGVSTLWAVARHHHSKSIMHAFTINFRRSKERFLICFESPEMAEDWRLQIQDVIRGGMPELSQRRMSATSLEDLPEGEHGRRSSYSVPTTPQKSSRGAQEQNTPARLDLTSATNDAFQTQMEEVWGTSPNLLIESVNERSSVEHVNGVAVYQEGPTPDGQSGAFLVSAVIAASPRVVFEKLAGFDVNKERPKPFNWELLQRIDSHARVVRHRMPAGRFARFICAPREIVMQQTWREDEDGTITMLGHSVDHPAARTDPSWSWYAPIRVQVESAGFTMAPLQPSYRNGGGSDSCLCTFVLKLDLGGCLSEASYTTWFLYPMIQQVVRSFIDPALMSIIALRDQVEQSKYVTQSFMPSTEALPDDPIPSAQVPSLLSELQAVDGTSLGRSHSRVIASPFDETSDLLGTNLTPEQVQYESVEDSFSFSESLQRAAGYATLDSKYWSCPGAAGFHVRGPTYLKDQKKIPAETPLFSLASVDFVKCTGRASHIARHLESIKKTTAPFNFIMNLMLPGSQNMAMVATWAAEQAPSNNQGFSRSSGSREIGNQDSDSEIGLSPFDTVLARFLSGDDDSADTRRNGVFKLIPTIVKGSWMIKQSVGHTPVLLGRKLKTYYHRGPNYFEVDVDVTSSRAANSITGMVQGATSNMIIDLGIVLEGHTDDELPECLLGTIRFDHLDMKAYTILNNSSSEA